MSEEAYVRMIVRFSRGRLSIAEARRVAGRLPRPETVASGLVHEVRIRGRQAAFGSMADAGVSRSFSEPSEGPTEHHIAQEDEFEFVVRVPEVALRGVDSNDMEIEVLNATSRYEPVRLGLHDDPTVEVATIASYRPRTRDELPEELRRITAREG